jgi:hypothetical protein
LLVEIIAVYCQNQRRGMNILSEKTAKFSNTAADGTYNFHVFFKATIRNLRNETKEIPLYARIIPEIFYRLRLPDFKTIGT